MKIKNIIAVSGESGLFELVSSKNNGLILSNPKTGKSNFYSMRIHQFTPLETIGIYTMDDTVDIKDIFNTMTAKKAELPLPSVKDDNKKLMSYFVQILPDYDPDKVYPSDVKKVIKWYNAMEDCGFLTAQEETGDEEE
ncbi:MAG: DUF5606 domain-containing protein [Saprospiraceae bacterium]|nr:DUF5606 domain-containing protein [Saprospiraceae bacterium]